MEQSSADPTTQLSVTFDMHDVDQDHHATSLMNAASTSLSMDDPSVSGIIDDLSSADVELERLKSKTQAMKERKKAREEAAKRQRELERIYEQHLVTSSVELLDFAKTFFDFLEVLPREAMQQQQQQAEEGSSSSKKVPQEDDADNENENTEPEEDTPSEVFYMTPAFLFHSVESFFARLGIILRKRVGAGGIITVERHRKTLQHVQHAQYPRDVVTVMQAFLKLYVVPPSVLKENDEANPFDFTFEDEVWERVSHTTQEWLAMIQVDDSLFDLNEFRTLLNALQRYPVPRLTKALKYVTRDLVSVLASDRDVTVDDDVTQNIHHHKHRGHHDDRQHQPLRRPSQFPTNLPSITDNVDGGSRSPGRTVPDLDENDTMLVGASVSPHPRDHQHQQQKHSKSPPKAESAGIEVMGRTLDPPLSFSPYKRLATAHWVPQREAESVLAAEKFHYGSQIGEPPLSGTQCRVVLQARHSHYLYGACNMPVAATSSSGGEHVGASSTSQKKSHSRRRPSAQVLRDAVQSRLTPSGRVVKDADAGAQVHITRSLTPLERTEIIRRLPDGPKLLEARARAAAHAGVKLQRPSSHASPVLSQVCFPMIVDPFHSAPGTTSSKLQRRSTTFTTATSNVDVSMPNHHSHLVLPFESVCDALARAEAIASQQELRRKQNEEQQRQHQKLLLMTSGVAADSSAPAQQGGGGQKPTPLSSPQNESVVITTIRNTTSNNVTYRDLITSSDGVFMISHTPEAEGRRQLEAELEKSIAERKKRARKSVRLATLFSLQGKEVRGPDEDLNAYWQRLQATEFKLSLLRGGSMSEEERSLWQVLWIKCHECIEVVFQILKSAAVSVGDGKKKSEGMPGGDDDTVCRHDEESEYSAVEDSSAEALVQEITGQAVSRGLEERLEELMAEFRQRAMDGIDGMLSSIPRSSRPASSGLDSATRGPTTVVRSQCAAPSATKQQVPHYASGIQKTYRTDAVERLFNEHGVRAFEMWTEKKGKGDSVDVGQKSKQELLEMLTTATAAATPLSVKKNRTISQNGSNIIPHDNNNRDTTGMLLRDPRRVARGLAGLSPPLIR